MGNAAKKVEFGSEINSLQSELKTLFTDKDHVIDATLCALISSGHVLLEDVPGVGKTTFIKALAKMLGLGVSRIQFTADLLPADITGIEVFSTKTGEFEFHKGPIFTNVVIADELNRASPRTQSALLEAMGEGCVTVDRKTHDLPKPFMVFASQNPAENLGTYDLPESQLDRFSAKLNLGYPDAKRELEIIQDASDDPLKSIPSDLLGITELESLRTKLDDIHVSKQVAEYAQRFVHNSRSSPEFKLGISTRGAVGWIRMAKANAVISGRDYILPDDLQLLANTCLSHRVAATGGGDAEPLIKRLLETTEI